jgi:hypothetical protein
VRGRKTVACHWTTTGRPCSSSEPSWESCVRSSEEIIPLSTRPRHPTVPKACQTSCHQSGVVTLDEYRMRGNLILHVYLQGLETLSKSNYGWISRGIVVQFSSWKYHLEVLANRNSRLELPGSKSRALSGKLASNDAKPRQPDSNANLRKYGVKRCALTRH